MQAYQGYFEDGHFMPSDSDVATLPTRGKAILLFVEDYQPAKPDRSAALEKLFSMIDASKDEILDPADFPRMNFTRELDL
jgi:hypothetical protein